MKRFAVAASLLAVSLAGVALADEKALKELEGSYVVTVLEKGGKAAPKEVMDGLKVSIKGDALTITVGGEEKKAKIKVDGAKTPATIDILPSDGAEKGKTFPGIYKVEKGEVTIVFHEKESDRPKEFKSEGEGMLMKLKKAEEKK
jgi:uncharacterized protein (TIGR03067 family)